MTQEFHGKNEIGDWVVGYADQTGNCLFTYTSGKYQGKFFGVDKDRRKLGEGAAKINFPKHLIK